MGSGRMGLGWGWGGALALSRSLSRSFRTLEHARAALFLIHLGVVDSTDDPVVVALGRSIVETSFVRESRRVSPS